jgi:eukaryotic-like serine/threonine-protein kinase
MGVVYRAHDTLLERVVALKIISTSIEDNPDLRERFFREARAAGQLSHRNIITIHDLGEHEGQPFLSMEFLTGEDLQHRLARQEPMSLRRKLEVASEICDGLSFAHRRGLVHRDVKPANIFITDDGVVKLLDFGLARMVTSELTRSNMMMGTLNYMSPEQVRGERTDHRADIFSFGVVLYEMLSGRKAFQGDSFATTLYKILQDVPEPLHNIDSTIPEELVWLVEKTLAKPRDERYQELTDVLRDFAVIRQHLSGSDAVTTASTVFPPQRLPSDPPRSSGSGPRRLSDTPPLSPAPAAPSDRPITAVQATSRRWGFAWGALAVIAVAAVGWLALRESPDKQRTTEQAPPPAVTQPAQSPQPQEPSSPQAQPPQPAPAPPAQEASPPPQTVSTPEASRRAANDARVRMNRAKAAARQAGSAATSSASYGAALAAEREGQRLYQAGQSAEAAAKFYEANGLFRSAELATPPAPTPAPAPQQAPPPSQRPETQPAAPAPQPAAPAPQPTPTVPRAEGPVELPSVPAPRAPTAPAPPPRTTTPPITAAEGTASPGAEEAIRDMVRRYAQALESRNVEALKRVWPTLQGAQEEAVRKEFLHARRIDVDIDDTNIAVSGTTGTVTFIRRYRLSTVDGQRLDTNSRTTMSVRRAGNEWVIDRVRFEALR